MLIFMRFCRLFCMYAILYAILKKQANIQID